jgi:hypothetical protein
LTTTAAGEALSSGRNARVTLTIPTTFTSSSRRHRSLSSSVGLGNQFAIAVDQRHVDSFTEVRSRIFDADPGATAGDGGDPPCQSTHLATS